MSETPDGMDDELSEACQAGRHDDCTGYASVVLDGSVVRGELCWCECFCYDRAGVVS